MIPLQVTLVPLIEKPEKLMGPEWRKEGPGEELPAIPELSSMQKPMKMERKNPRIAPDEELLWNLRLQRSESRPSRFSNRFQLSLTPRFELRRQESCWGFLRSPWPRLSASSSAMDVATSN